MNFAAFIFMAVILMAGGFLALSLTYGEKPPKKEHDH